MSTDFSIRPVGAPVATPIITTAGDAPRGAVATQLPPSQTVNAADASVSIRNDSQTPSDFVSRQAFFDRAAASVVFQVVDGKTDQVVQQFPDEAVLRRRAYFRSLDLAREASTRPLATDLKA
jgi:hypothetical protein